MPSSHLNRRQFMGGAAAALPLAAASPAVAIILNSDDPVAAAAPSVWAAEELRKALASRGVSVKTGKSLSETRAEDFCILIAGRASAAAVAVAKTANVTVASRPESLGLISGKSGERSVLLACGHDTRGVVYAVLELADRARNSPDPVAALAVPKPVVESPANRIRSINRAICSDVEDLPWFRDRAMWPEYLTMLATQRWNRFNLTLGLGYDVMRQVLDGYFLFPYPFLVKVPGYDVTVTGLSDGERESNLEMLRFISSEAARRGLDFQLGLWTHAYEWIDTPQSNHFIRGVNPQNHAPYCRDALAAVLQACPAITGVNIRIHGESGVAEGSYDFWRVLFEGMPLSGRKIEIEMHAKGIDRQMIDIALDTGQKVVVSPKYWAEHFGLPYHQADIRKAEKARSGASGSGLFKLSSGERSFMRYGYGDLYKENRKYGIMYRMFPGSLRHLLWGDPQIASGYGRISSFCGADGVELQEPLYFKGRRGSGMSGGRLAYADPSLTPRWDWEKYLYYYRIFGRHLYNPKAEADVWRRWLRQEFGAAAADAELAMANASRVIPTFTTAHGASAAHNSYWVEMYVNMSLTDPKKHHYSDTPAPKVFGNVSPFDPQLFSRINDYVTEMLHGERTGKYSPVEVACWLEDYAAAGATHLAAAKKLGPKTPAFRRFTIDAGIHIGLGRFYAAKLRAGTLFGIFEQSGDRTALEAAIKQYRAAGAAWAEFALPLREVYKPDITYGEQKYLRGHWADRIGAIEDDIASLEIRLEQARAGESADRVRLAIQEALGRPKRPSVGCRHAPPRIFKPGRPVEVELLAERPVTVKLLYRHVNQAENYMIEEMPAVGNRHKITIPGEYTQTEYPLQYYFELHEGEAAWLYPGLNEQRSNLPYFVIRQG